MPSTYEMLMEELRKKPAPAAPMFTPEQIQARLAENNNQMTVGVLGQLAGDSRIRGAGGQVFKNAIASRDPRVTNRGITDPLTGETAIDPAYADEQEENRRQRILTQALNYESRRQAEQARAQEAEANRVFRRSLAAIAASNRKSDSGPPMPKPPSGYRYTDEGNLEPIPGGPAAAKADATDAANAARHTGIKQRVAQIKDLIATAKDQAGPFTTGFLGSQISKLPGGTAYDLRKTVDSIKANIGFQELQAMREASPTGGALGQVAVQELNFLQSVLGNLDPNQSEDQLRRNLDAVEKHMTNWSDAVDSAAGRRSGGASGGWDSPAPSQRPPAPSPAAPSTPAGGQRAAPRYRWDGTRMVPL